MTRYTGRHRAVKRAPGGVRGRGGKVAGASVGAIASAAVTAMTGPVDVAQATSFGEGPIGARLGPSLSGSFGASGHHVARKGQVERSGRSRDSAIVQRYVAAVDHRVNLRTSPTLRTPGTVAAKLSNGTALKGRYNSTGYWFRVSSGPWAGKWIAASLLQSSPHVTTLNGRLPRNQLAPVPRGSTRRVGSSSNTALAPATAHAFADMNAAFRARFGHDIGVVEGYRPIAIQRLYAKRFGYPRAAIPGTSNHGFGNAVDIGERGRGGTASPFYFGRVYDRWLTEHGHEWGFDRPSFMDAGGSNPEFWHYNFVG